MKHSTLSKRLDRISSPIKPPADFEAQAHAAWITAHLTPSEEDELVLALKRVEQLSPGTTTEQETDEILRLQEKGEQRARNESAQAWEEYRTNWIQAENLRRKGQLLTSTQSSELQTLNAWLDATDRRLSKFGEKQGSVGDGM